MSYSENTQNVTTAEEQAARELERQTVELNAFVAVWEMEDVPACVRGMALLKRFADVSPAGFQMALRRGLVDPMQQKHPLFESSTAWQSFVRHWSDCPDCNEV